MSDFSRIKLGTVYTFGSDPEIFSRDSKGQILPAFKFLPSKEKPIEVSGAEDDYLCVYNDGFQAELRALPHPCIAYVVDSIQRGLKEIWKKSNGANLVIDNAPMIPMEVLKESPDEHVILGCDPSQNAYNMGGKVVGDPRKLRYRFTGWHLHASGWYVPKTEEKKRELFVPYIKAMDSILGMFFVAAGAHLESKKRREYYGLAGEYRLPPHGLEYRTLSSVVLSHPGIVNFAMELARGIIALVDSKAQDLWIADEEETIGVINQNNQKAARAIITRNKELFMYLTYFARNGNLVYRGWGKAAYDLAMNGIDSFVKDPNDFITNWKFRQEWSGHGDGQGESWRSLIANPLK